MMTPSATQLPHLIFMVLFLFSQSVTADVNELAIFPLKHKPAQELVRHIRPLVKETGSVSAFSDKLIVRAPSRQLEEIRWLVSEFDKPARNLLIEVNLGKRLKKNEIESVASTRGGKENRQTHFSAHQAYTKGKNSSQQHIRTLDGHAALIRTGESIPVYQAHQEGSGRHRTQSYEVQYRDISRGFYALPRLQGDQVTLEIYQHSDHASTRTGQFNVQQASSTVQGRLGEWIELGGIGQQNNENKSRQGYSGSTQKQRQLRVSLRVTEIPN